MIAIDTNILVHAHRRDASLHTEASHCIRELAEGSVPWCICFHSLVEYYGIVTHPKIWSDPSTPFQAADQISAWRESPRLRLIAESADDINPLMDLAKKSKTAGPMIHDARIASCCLANGVTCLWTVDREFGRFPELRVKNPLV